MRCSSKASAREEREGAAHAFTRMPPSNMAYFPPLRGARIKWCYSAAGFRGARAHARTQSIALQPLQLSLPERKVIGASLTVEARATVATVSGGQTIEAAAGVATAFVVLDVAALRAE